jgi:hypothetical protein
MLSHAARRPGLGWGFGLHQALDQTGAVVEPLAVSWVLFLGNDYRAAFAVLLAPALLSISLVLAARMSFPRPHDFDLPPALKPRAWPGLFGSTSRSGSVPTSR